MPKTLIKFGNIAKRSASINAKSTINVNEYNSIEKNYRTFCNKVDNGTNKDLLKSNIIKVLESLADSNTANKYINYPFSIIEKMNPIDKNYADYITESFCTLIIPYIKDTGLIAESVNSYNLTDKQKEHIVKTANVYSICDRIINNHNTISRRFNTEATIVNGKYNLKSAIESVCTMIDTYNRDSYQKMNICLEEVFYIVEKNNINCKKSDIANTIVEYFLLSSPELSEKNYNGYKKAINESCFLNEDDTASVLYLNTNRDDNTNDSNIRSFIAGYYTAPVRNKELLEETIKNCMASDILDITYNFSAILDFILMVYKAENLISDTDLELVMKDVETLISGRISTLANDAELSRDTLSDILLHIVSKVKEAESIIATYPRVREFIAHLKNILQVVSPYYDLLYDKDNIDTINDMENSDNEVDLSEAVVMKAHNLIVALRNLDKYLGDKCKAAVNKLIGTNKDDPSIRQKISNILFNDDKEGTLEKAFKKGLENEKKAIEKVSTAVKGLIMKENDINIYSYISEETCKFDMVLDAIEFKKDEEVSDIQDQLSSVCKEFNHILENNYSTSNFRLYYLVSPGEVSLHIADPRKYRLDEDTILKIREAYKPDFDKAITALAEAEAKAEFIKTIGDNDIEDSLFSYFKDKEMDLEKFDTILEALSLVGVQKSVVEKFGAKFNDYNFYAISEEADFEKQSKEVESLIDKYKTEDIVPDDIKLEAYLVLNSLLENYTDEDFDDSDDDYDDDLKKSVAPDDGKPSDEELDELKKNPYKGLNLNSMKLVVQGLKSKFKNMSQKEKEISREVDDAFKHLVTSFKNALISDSRESIIKGSVIPSFSKCLKIGIPAAVGIGTGIINPGVAAIVALGSFAVSKHLTKKERILLLDEIETELEVVEKEIQMAEREEDMKKYRALLQYKKNLQRQYQRIRYNVKIGKNILPNSNFGVSGDHDNGY